MMREEIAFWCGVFTIAALLSIAVLFNYEVSQRESKAVQMAFTEQAVEEINAMLAKVEGRNAEFGGVLEVSDGTVLHAFYIGTKDLDTGKVEVEHDPATPAGPKWSIHSHPNGVCAYSDDDVFSAKSLGEEGFCIVCGYGRVKCYVTTDLMQ